MRYQEIIAQDGKSSTTSFYLETGSTDPTYNLAFEEYVLRNRCKGDYLILWQNQNSVIIGRNQNALEEINQEFVDTNGIQVVRRNTGGGAVYHDLGNLNYSFITDAQEGDTQSGNRFTATVIKALKALGLDAESSGRNDILVNGKKVSGTAQHRIGNRILHHGTLLFDSNADMISGSLNPDPTKFQSKSIKSVRSRVGNIRSMLSEDLSLPAFWAHLRGALSQEGAIYACLSCEELAAVEALRAAKYTTWQWNYGSSPKFDSKIRRRLSGGLLEIHLTVKHGRIDSLAIYGDFLALQSIDPLILLLTDVAYREDHIYSALSDFPLADYLGSITLEEFVDTLLNR